MSDVCYAPVLDMDEAEAHPHNKARKLITSVGGIAQPAPAPRFSRTPSQIQGPPALPGQHTDTALADWGFTADEIAALHGAQAIA